MLESAPVQRERNHPAQALNETLSRCRGPIMHVLDNDQLCLRGWDAYVLDRFERLPELGQLGTITGASIYRGKHYRDLVVLAPSHARHRLPRRGGRMNAWMEVSTPLRNWTA